MTDWSSQHHGLGAYLCPSFEMCLQVDDLCERATTAQQPHEEQHDRNDQQHVDECADGVDPNESEQPRNQENYSYGVQHRESLPC